MSGVVAPLVVFLALGWVALLLAAPFLPAVPTALTYLLGSRICHQISERSFHVDGVQLPVCARCLGIYAGMAIGAVFATVSQWGQTPLHADSSLARARAVVAVGALPTMVTVLAEWAGLWQTSNVTRLLAGVPLGAAGGLVVMAALAAPPGPLPRVAVGWATLRRMRVSTADQPRSASLTYLICALAWAIPGGGHLWLGRREKGLIFLVALPVMFMIGLGLEGRLFPFELTQPLVALAAFADLGMGIPFFIAKVLGAGAGQVVAITYEYGNAFLIVAGLLNMLVVLDVFDIAQGRK